MQHIWEANEHPSSNQINKLRKINENTVVDIVDENDHVVGTSVRKDLFRNSYNFRVAHLLLVDGSGDILLQQLSSTHVRNAHSWGSSAAGFVHTKESYQEAMHRIILKELGVKQLLLKSVGNFSMIDDGAKKYVGIFVGRVPDSMEPDRDQISTLKLVSRSQLDNEVSKNPDKFTPTFLMVYKRYNTLVSNNH